MPVDRRRLGVASLLVVAVALVALAARGDHGDRDAQAWRVPTSVSGTAEAMVALLAVLGILVVAALTVWAVFPDGRHKLELRKRSIRGTVAALVMLILITALLGEIGRGGRDHRPERPVRVTDTGSATSADDRGGDTTAPRWGLGLAGVALLLAAGGAVALRRRVVPLDLPSSAAPPAPPTPEAVADAVADAEACTDPRQSILLAFAAAETLLAADRATRRPPATSAREWAMAVRIAALDALVGRYEIARFSNHDVTEEDRRVALRSLRALA